ncbi:Protein phosphatase 4 core regulatory subunit R [Parasponia andersonii]|uniref:Protein phosphatase 4 core regulatory subunit R n=1 Tax=Parasponia andersonii TaxID=3476 RepID=A0A2P5AY24_PARAD|nr:Protein phosphatase 4 core regulatory subunit R [Parasponia andersonii]
MEIASNEDLEKSPTSANDARHPDDNMVPDVLNHGGEEPKLEIAEKEARGILEVIASTGKFWHEWDKLKAILSFQLKQVLSEYPEETMTDEQQNASLGETFTELVKRLNEALNSFDQGPPFTLQRLCEILLDARGVYPNLSKLALALEKNLLVTSMLSISGDPYPQSTIEPNEPEKANEEPEMQSSSVQNGVEHMSGDGDEVMAEVEEADIDDNMTIDMEAFEDLVGSSETNTAAANDS